MKSTEIKNSGRRIHFRKQKKRLYLLLPSRLPLLKAGRARGLEKNLHHEQKVKKNSLSIRRNEGLTTKPLLLKVRKNL